MVRVAGAITGCFLTDSRPLIFKCPELCGCPSKQSGLDGEIPKASLSDWLLLACDVVAGVSVVGAIGGPVRPSQSAW